jgi:hypothetical protein
VKPAYEPGQLVGRWTLLAYQPGQKTKGEPRRKSRWQCRCDCGVVRLVWTDNLRSGFSKSCGHDGKSYRVRAPAVNSVFALGSTW